jgi:hypothetical protein
MRNNHKMDEFANSYGLDTGPPPLIVEGLVFNMDEAPQPNVNPMDEIEGVVRGCLWSISELLSPGETESIGFDEEVTPKPACACAWC